MVTVQIDERDLLDLLINRVKFWTNNNSIIKLYKGYYQSKIDWGGFDGTKFDAMLIVDNDYINNLRVYDTIDDACADFGCTAEEIDSQIAYQDENGILIYN